MAMSEVVGYLETFGCDMQHPGIPEFIGLFNWVVSAKRRGATGAQGGNALRDIAAARGKYYLALNSTMKAALRPLLEAEPEALAYFGLQLPKRTVCAAADALADKILADLESSKTGI